MDLLEWAFHKLSVNHAQKMRRQEAAFSVRTEDELTSLRALLALVLNGESLPIFSGKGLGRVSQNQILLPEKIYLFKNPEMNRQVLIHKILVASMIYQKNNTYTSEGLNYAERTLQIWKLRNLIRNELSVRFSQFEAFSMNLENQLSQVPTDSKREEIGFKKLLAAKSPANFYRWSCFPEQGLALWVEPLETSRTSAAESVLSRDDHEEKNKSQGTLIEGNSSTEVIQEVSLASKKQEQNPVFHAFEKLETADEYNGGSRVSDAKDEVQDHSEALSELNLKHVTREGGGAGSIYKGHLSELIGANLIKTTAPRWKQFRKVPEWDYKKKTLVPDHCRLYLLDEFHEPSISLGTELKDRLRVNYASEIEFWKNKIGSLVNKKHWMDRQLDGPEWSLDSYIRYCSDLQANGNGDTKFFMKNYNCQRDLQVSILMDASFSTESWIENRKVLDIQLESIGLCGLLLDDLKESVSIWATWSETRHHCYLRKIKDANAPWNQFFQQAEQLTPRGYTRLGPAIRHITSEFESTGAKNKLFILLTDGKPTDLDHYEGRYGIEDIRHAILEARQLGIHVQALAIDKEAKFYFPQIFNRNSYQILSDPKLLPEQLFKIYVDFTNRK